MVSEVQPAGGDDVSEAHILITKNGPYLVSGQVPLNEQAISVAPEGNTWDYADTGVTIPPSGGSYALCRCGRSANKPFCDGTHVKTGFDGTETANRRPFAETAEHADGPALDLADDRALCAFARICDGYGRVWNTVQESHNAEKAEIVAHQGSFCPSGRLVVTPHGGGEPIELAFDPSIVLLEDPQQRVSGPIWARGGITLESADGFVYERRNRVTLCRCGQSTNKPFCDGTHAHVGFRAHPEEPGGAATSSEIRA
jgi:CDGSH-type Zn-finger protein